VVDASGANSRALNVCGNSLNFAMDGFTICNASNALNGAGVYIAGAYNVAGQRVINCLFSNNTSTLGGTWNGGGGLYMAASSGTALLITNSTFVLNSAAGFGGGAAFAPYQTAASRVVGCQFLNNRANLGAGGLWFSSNSYDSNPANRYSVRGCLFEGNAVTNTAAASVYGGGGLYNHTQHIWVYQSTFRSNVSVKGCAVGGNSYWVGGFTLENCLVYNNFGGGTVWSTAATPKGSATVTRSTCCIPRLRITPTAACTVTCPPVPLPRVSAFATA